MTTTEKRRHEMLVRVRDFGLARGDRFPKSTLGAEAFAAVDAAVNNLNQHAATEFSSRRGARGGASTDTAASRALVETVEAISRTARAVALDTPGAAPADAGTTGAVAIPAPAGTPLTSTAPQPTNV